MKKDQNLNDFLKEEMMVTKVPTENNATYM